MDDNLNIVKGIAIFSVILFHVTGFWGYSIYMLPVFFILSGYLNKEFINWKNFVYRKTTRLIVPYVIYGFLFVLLGYISNGTYPLRETLFNLVMGGKKLQSVFGTFWFVNVLFVSLMIFNLSAWISQKWLCTLLFMIVSLMIAMLINHHNICLPWSLQTVPIALSYMYCGQLCKFKWKVSSIDSALSCVPLYVSVVSLLVLFVIVVCLPDSMLLDLKSDNYGMPLISWFLSVVTSALLLLSVRTIKLLRIAPIFSFAGANSLSLMFVHQYLNFGASERINRYVVCAFVLLFAMTFCYLVSLSPIAKLFGCACSKEMYEKQ